MFASAFVLSVFPGLLAGALATDLPVDTSPYGLAWGQSRQQIERAGIALAECRPAGDSEVCIAANLPAPLADEGVYRVFIHNQGGLDAVRFTSAPVTDDRKGIEGRALYERVRAVVSARHGAGRRQEFIFRTLPAMGEDRFYECLHRSGRCGLWTSEWRGLGIALTLQARDPAEGGGIVTLVHYRPEPTSPR